MGEGSTGTRVAAGMLGRRVGVLTTMSGVGTAVEVEDTVGDGGTLVGVDSGDASVTAGEGAPGVRVAVGTATNSLDVAVASGPGPRVSVPGGPTGRDGVGAGSGGNTAHAASVAPSKMTSRLESLGFIYYSGLMIVIPAGYSIVAWRP